MGSTQRALAGLLAGLALAVPPAAAGQDPPTPVPAAPSATKAPPVQLVFWLGRDFGTTNLVTVDYASGGSDTLKANEGLILAVGATFLKLQGGRFESQATVGYKRASISASNGSITTSAIPLELLEAWYAGPLRLAAGLSLQLGAKVEGSGVASSLDASFKPSLGLVLQAAWCWRLGAERRWRLDAGVRFTWQTLQLSSGPQPTTDANAIGLLVGAGY